MDVSWDPSASKCYCDSTDISPMSTLIQSDSTYSDPICQKISLKLIFIQ